MPSHARSLKKFLKQQSFGTSLKITSQKDERSTGGFVVTVQPSGRVLHEKTRRVGGLCKTVEERQELVDKIDVLLKEKR